MRYAVAVAVAVAVAKARTSWRAHSRWAEVGRLEKKRQKQLTKRERERESSWTS